ncbi:MAG: glyoxalase/bleomycin resistance/dioxygenase family protein [Rhodospirillales bacterium]|nr:glyoxalase/bleomycin resistance/dioxygenase family protein [Rhodospirillales bacterium]
MKRLHVHMNVTDLDKAVGFYSTLFAATPTVLKDDYAKWMLNDPLVNFAISSRGSAEGLSHLGIEAETPAELVDVYDRLEDAGGPTLKEGATTCCYHQSEKSWIDDPAGVSWETFMTTGESTTFGTDAKPSSACCG